MRAGNLDRQVVIEQLTTSRNDLGEEIHSWSTLATVWAQRQGQKVVQRFNSNQQFAEVDAIFKTRWYPWATTIDPLKHRLQYRNRIYDIHGTEELGRREGVMILTKARADNEAGGP